MTQYINDRRFSTIQRTDWNGELPEIISFTDFLRWNYTVDYGRYIRNLHSNNMLPLRLGIPAEAEIKTIIIEDGRYDRIDHDSFFMYVICNVLFINNGYSYQQKYVVHGYYRSGGSDFLMDIELYNGEYIHLDHPMDEFLVPILSKKDFENIADEIVEQYYPYKANYPCMINALAIAKAMGLKVDYARLSNDGKVRSKIILDNRITTVYDDKKQEMPIPVYVPTILIDESLKETDEEQNAIIHECVHAYLHNLFYELQSHYRKIVGRRMPEFDDYFSSKSQQICLKWMETQACSIPRFIQMPADQTTDFILNFLDGIAGEPKWSDYRELIDLVKSNFGVARNTAKKRIIELGWLDVRGVYMYNGRGYVEDYDVDWNFPDNYTYTLSLRHISEAYSNSDTFAELIRTQRFIYIDGHVVLNTDKYVKKENGSVIGLTEYARHHMADCCIDFKKIYAEFDYSYTYGELHKDALTPINDDNRILTDEQRKKIRLALYELSDESMKLEVHPVQDEMARAVIFHMQRCGVTVDEVADRSGMGVDTVMKLRKGRKATGKFKLETILAFCVALELEEAFRVDLMHKARVEFDMENPAHRMYLTILDLLPDANVFQINDLLRAEGFTPWTRENEEPKRKARKKKEAV